MTDDIPFVREFNFEYGKVERLSPMIRRVVANNPNYFTFYGTNTYILGSGEVALIDPGPDIPEHINAILNGLGDEVITHILVTHTHFDHWPACKSIQAACSAKTYGFTHKDDMQNRGDRSAEARILSNQERFEITGFIPDIRIVNGDVIQGNDWSVECVFSPGHASNHMCFQLLKEKALFSGDHVMGWSTSVISPPSGNMEDYMNSLDLLLQRDDILYWPAHGPGIQDTKNYVKSFIAHRKKREQQILDELAKGPNSISGMVSDLYNDVPEHLHPAAQRSMLACVVYLIKRGVIACNEEASVNSKLFLNAKE